MFESRKGHQSEKKTNFRKTVLGLSVNGISCYKDKFFDDK